MARTIDSYGTATLNSTLGAGGVTPSVDVTCALTHTTYNQFQLSVVSAPQDVLGDIQISGTLTSSVNLRVSASRQIPAGNEIVFNWVVLSGTA